MALDILFINPGNQKAIYQDLALEFTALDVPVWACLLAESIRRQGRSVQIHDMNIQGWDDATRDRLLAEKPRLVVVMVYGHHPSASTQTMPVVRPLLQDLKAAAPDIPLAIGGTHPS
ncbi:MAG TPA: cobalamin B12-binding domain-containing protein, partial [Kiritimatiellia bacterium]|nr:cobalamin B12-binding domain-containing protein [Kiritimatiellia bacterium]